MKIFHNAKKAKNNPNPNALLQVSLVGPIFQTTVKL